MPQPLTDPRWAEAVIMGKHFPPRTAHAAALLSNHLFLYGGTDASYAMFDDLWRIPLEEQTFHWEMMGRGPGPRKYHTMVSFKGKLYAFGGKSYASRSKFFVEVEFTGEHRSLISLATPELEGHCALVHGQQMLVYGGIDQRTQDFSNQLFSYNFTSCEWKPLPTKGSILARSHFAAQILNGKLFVFGGDSCEGVLNDLYQLDLTSLCWTRVDEEGGPSSRRGSTMVGYKDMLFVFGGILQVTKQKNDMHVFSGKKWLHINSQSSHLYDCSPTIRKVQPHEQPTNHPRKLQAYSPPVKQSYRPTIKSHSHDKLSVQARMRLIRQDSRNKLAQASKAQLLSHFGPSQQKSVKRSRKLSPASEAVMHTLSMVGGQQRKELNELINHYKEEGRTSRIKDKRMLQGKRPCARDGHTATRFNNFMLILGGDRHTMPLNDLLFFCMDTAILTIPQYN